MTSHLVYGETITPSSCGSEAQSQDPAPSVLQQPDQATAHTATPKDTTQVPHQHFNIGNNQPIQLSRFIQAIETACNKPAEKIMLPMQPGDVERTYADTSRLEEKPVTSLRWKSSRA